MSYLCTRKTERTNAGAVVQLVRILACHARGRGFESRPHRKRSLGDGSKASFLFDLYPAIIQAFDDRERFYMNSPFT